LVSKISWQNLFDTSCWIKRYHAELEKEKNYRLALSFMEQHGDSAPFIACLNIATSSSEKEKRAAMCFMQVFPDDCEAWYLYNEDCPDPLVKTDKKCRCLPRHAQDCPVAKKQEKEKKKSVKSIVAEINARRQSGGGGGESVVPPVERREDLGLEGEEAVIEIEGLEERSLARILGIQASSNDLPPPPP